MVKPEKVAVTRKYNLGNYQTVDYHVEGSVDVNEDPRAALEELERIISDYWGGRTQALVAMAKKETQK